MQEFIPKKYKNWLRMLLSVLCLVLMLVSAYQLFSIWKASNDSKSLNESMQQAVHETTPVDAQESGDASDSASPAEESQNSDENASSTAGNEPTNNTVSDNAYSPVEVDFDQLHQQNKDIIAWLYSPGTDLNYPIAQSSDNDYYLRRLLDGSYNVAGTIFADYRNANDFSDWSTLVYGHNMKNTTMFGSLPSYQDPAYYKDHPFMYLLTPSQNYRIDLIGGFVTSTSDSLYGAAGTKEERDHLIEEAKSKSDFEANVEVDENDRLITLSTCAYEFENARYVVIGKLVVLP